MCVPCSTYWIHRNSNNVYSNCPCVYINMIVLLRHVIRYFSYLNVTYVYVCWIFGKKVLLANISLPPFTQYMSFFLFFFCYSHLLHTFSLIKDWYDLLYYRYNSKFRDNVKQEYVSGRGDHKTMGQAKVPAPTTDNFLKKRTKDVILPRGILS